MGSPFGAAGALAVLLVWIYYTSQVFLFGAEFTQVYTRRSGRPVVPKHGAVLAPGAELAAQPPGAGAGAGRVARSSGQMTPAQKR